MAEAERLELDDVHKRYPGGVDALHEVSLSVGAGRFLVLLGPSGSGKSTLIRCLAGIERPTAGTIAINGAVVADGRRHVPPEQRDLAMVFQDFALWPHMTVAENVAFALRRGRGGKGDPRKRSLEMLERVGLHLHAKRYPHELSGGEQQRVSLARALVGNPGLLLFDEPLSSLDANLRERLRIEIGTLVREQGATAVYITHDQSEAFALGDEIGVLQSGRMVQHGPPEAIYRNPATPFVARFTGLAGAFAGYVSGPGPAGPGPITVVVPSTDPARSLELAATAMSELAPGAPVQVMLRPTAARICRTGSRSAMLRGIVRDSAFHGRGYDYVIELGEGLQLTGVFDRRHFNRGDVVELFVKPEGSLVFADDEERGAPLLSGDAVVRAVPPSVSDATRSSSIES
ncbi:MAG: ABC transporter ATP-binding protein [Conexibacteraceae bacterium]|nr:ABC transporter ATP-binding protein [Conexibacteraceae bacterium]